MFLNGEAAHISSAFEDWLVQERVNADAADSNNAYLSEYEPRRADMFKPYSDPTNFQANKAISHHDRLINFVQPYPEADFRTDDRFAARLIFCCLMEIAGSYRKQCFFEASDAQDYWRRRYQTVWDIPAYQVVTAEVNPIRGEVINDMSQDERIEYIVGRTLTTIDQSRQLHSSIHEWSMAHMERSQGGVLAVTGEPPVEAMRQSQSLWCGLAAAHIAVAASLRGNDLAKVPVLEPTSISHAKQLLYPFAA